MKRYTAFCPRDHLQSRMRLINRKWSSIINKWGSGRSPLSPWKLHFASLNSEPPCTQPDDAKQQANRYCRPHNNTYRQAPYTQTHTHTHRHRERHTLTQTSNIRPVITIKDQRETVKPQNATAASVCFISIKSHFSSRPPCLLLAIAELHSMHAQTQHTDINTDTHTHT